MKEINSNRLNRISITRAKVANQRLKQAGIIFSNVDGVLIVNRDSNEKKEMSESI